MAFFNTPEVERLYSGVAKIIASCAETALRNSVYSLGLFSSYSSLYNGKFPISKNSTSTSAGNNSANATDHLRAYDSLRKLPTTTPIFVIKITSP